MPNKGYMVSRGVSKGSEAKKCSLLLRKLRDYLVLENNAKTLLPSLDILLYKLPPLHAAKYNPDRVVSKQVLNE